MARVSVVPRERVAVVPLPHRFSGDAETRAYLSGPKAPLHLFIHEFRSGTILDIGPTESDCLAYVWTGEVEAEGERLYAGSSLVVEHGATLRLVGAGQGAQVLTFTAAETHEPSRAGGRVHLLPRERVLRVPGMISGVNGGMHFDSDCPTCEIWLHENEFTPAFITPESVQRSPHSHTEDEIIFVTAGQMRLGNRLYAAGTALAVSANTMYSFNPGPEGISFVNFRAAKPGDIIRADGQRNSETAGWQRHLGGNRPNYIEPDAPCRPASADH